MNKEEIKFLIDVGVSKKVEIYLMENGYDIKSIRNIDPRMDDKKILEIAVDENRTVITMDKDFGELVYRLGLPHTGVLLLRLDDATANEKVKIVQNILSEHLDKIEHNFCVFQHGKLRIKTK